jgi:hypothetical protein
VIDVGGDALVVVLVLVGLGLLDEMIAKLLSSILAGGKCFVIISHKQTFVATSTSLLLLPLPHYLLHFLHPYDVSDPSTGGI